ncbi:MAG: potassium-transporting ATPase subunit KdpC [Chloroherpetonaceae bacterium]|nr:potassium-transporting ATPase subunit KdpC [Chloroherpetonaceae bacterium]
MKTFKQSLLLTFLLLLFFGGVYPIIIWAVGNLFPHQAVGSPVTKNGQIIGFENVGQNFSAENYFWGRPSAVGYNAASTGGSNLGPTNPAHLEAVKARIDTFLVYHPYLTASEIPADLVTASGGGLDPHISPKAAMIQVKRVAIQRKVDDSSLRVIVQSHIEPPIFGIFGTEKVNVLKLNLSLDEMMKRNE